MTNSFKPDEFLDLNLNELDREKVIETMLNYLTLRLLEIIPEKYYFSINNKDDVFRIAKSIRPDFDEFAKQIMIEFKSEFIKKS